MHVMSAVRSRSRRWVIRGLSRAHLAVHRVTRGGVLGSVAGMPVLLLTTTGRRSGKARTTPLTFFRDGTDLVVIASNGGADRPPTGRSTCSRPRARSSRSAPTGWLSRLGRRRSRNARVMGRGHGDIRRLRPLPGTDNATDTGHPSHTEASRSHGEPSPCVAFAARNSAKQPCLLRRIGRQGRTKDGGAHPGIPPVPGRDRPSGQLPRRRARTFADARAYEAWRHARPSPGRRWLYRPAMTLRVRHAAIPRRSRSHV